MAEVFVIGKFGPNPYPHAVEVDVTSHGSFKDLSPFYLGPITYECPHFGPLKCLRLENLWQYCKVYPEHIAMIGDGRYTPLPQIHPQYYSWRNRGFAESRATRYPMGKGKKPLFSLWGMQRLDYVKAKHKIYIPNYVDLARRTKSYNTLYNWLVQGHDLVLRDFDGFDYIAQGKSLKDIANDPTRSLGHGFVLAMMLKGELP